MKENIIKNTRFAFAAKNVKLKGGCFVEVAFEKWN